MSIDGLNQETVKAIFLLKKDLDNTKRENAELHDLLHLLETQCRDLKLKLGERENIDDALIEGQQAALRIAEGEVQKLQQQLRTSETAKEELSKRVRELEDESKATKQEVAALNRRIKKFQNEIEVLNIRHLEDLRKAEEEAGLSLENEVVELRGSVDLLQQRLQDEIALRQRWQEEARAAQDSFGGQHQESKSRNSRNDSLLLQLSMIEADLNDAADAKAWTRYEDLRRRHEELLQKIKLQNTVTERDDQTFTGADHRTWSQSQQNSEAYDSHHLIGLDLVHEIEDPRELDWVTETSDHPMPPFDLASPVIEYLLQTWSSDLKAREELKRWLELVAAGANLAQHGLSPITVLQRIPPEVRDGFLTLVVPLLRERRGSTIEISKRGHTNGYSDLKIRVVDKC